MHDFTFDIDDADFDTEYDIFWTYEILPDLNIFKNKKIVDKKNKNFPKKPPLKSTIFNNLYSNKKDIMIQPRMLKLRKLNKDELDLGEGYVCHINRRLQCDFKPTKISNISKGSVNSRRMRYSLAMRNSLRRVSIEGVDFDGFRTNKTAAEEKEDELNNLDIEDL